MPFALGKYSEILVMTMIRNARHRVGAAVMLASLFAVATTAQDQATKEPPKKYDLKLSWKATAGHKSEMSQDDSQVMTMKVLDGDGNVMVHREDDRARAFVASEVISKVRDDKADVSRWTFTKATQHRGDQDTPFAFQGRTVVVTKEAASQRKFAFDDGAAVTDDDATVLAELWGGEDKPGEPSGEDIFAPKKPVAVGEQWMPDVALIAEGLKLGDGIDLKRSTVRATLKSTETRDGVEFGNIELFLELWTTKFGPMQLDNPIFMKIDGNIDACIDGTLPDGIMNLTITAKGDSSVSVENSPTKRHILFDMEAKMLQRQKSIK
ncbi:MAG: hypothetical protein ACLQLC_00255 [Candidatus Sulfotelmatobacter sp.]